MPPVRSQDPLRWALYVHDQMVAARESESSSASSSSPGAGNPFDSVNEPRNYSRWNRRFGFEGGARRGYRRYRRYRRYSHCS